MAYLGDRRAVVHVVAVCALAAALLTASPLPSASAASSADQASGEGELVAIADLPDADSTTYFVSHEDGTATPLTSEQVEAADASPGDDVVLAGGRVLVAEAAADSTKLTHSVDIVLATVRIPASPGKPAHDAVPSSSLATARSWISYAADYYRTQSGGQVAGLSVGVERTLKAQTSCSPSAVNPRGELKMWDEAAAAVEAGRTAESYENSSGRHLLVVYPAECAQAWGSTTGVANVGALAYGGNIALVDSGLTQRQTFVHELGHNLGLGHANVYACTPLQLHWEGNTNCSDAEYADVYDAMGVVVDSDIPLQSPLLNAAHRDALGGYGADALRAIGADTTERITLLPAQSSSGVVAIRIENPDSMLYYLDLRNGRGSYDGGAFYALGSGCVVTSYCPRDYGVRITQRAPGGRESSATASRQNDGDSVSLVLGDRFSSSEGSTCNVWVRVDEMPTDSSGRPLSATLTIATGTHAPSCGDDLSSVPSVHPWFQAKYAELGGSSGPLGVPVKAMQCQSSSCWQEFVGGVLTSDGSQIVKLSTAYVTTWLANGGPDGALGLVAGPESCFGSYCVTPFSHGVIRWVPQVGVSVTLVHAWFEAKWKALGGVTGAIGSPVAAMKCQASSCWQEFTGGVLTSDGRQIVKLSTAYVSTWLAWGGPDGDLGLVAGGESCFGTYCQTPFAGGVIVWVPGSGVFPVAQKWFYPAWIARGGAAGSLGLPMDAMKCQSAACYQVFQKGTLTSSTAGVVALSSAYVSGWLGAGGPDGALGLITGPEACFGTYCQVPFQHGLMVWEPATGVRILTGAEADNWITSHQPKPQPPATGDPGDPGDTKNCSDFPTQAAAQEWFNRYYPRYGDVARLDQNGDGVACESLP